jgi:hypothetical protein
MMNGKEVHRTLREALRQGKFPKERRRKWCDAFSDPFTWVGPINRGPTGQIRTGTTHWLLKSHARDRPPEERRHLPIPANEPLRIAAIVDTPTSGAVGHGFQRRDFAAAMLRRSKSAVRESWDHLAISTCCPVLLSTL